MSTGVIASWLWDFGDGETSTEQNPSHTYGNPGNYTVSLTASGPNGSDIETKTDFISVRSIRATIPGIPLLLLDE
jgi:PKD repeat protein